MKSLFDMRAEEYIARQAPLAVRMRPQNLEEYVGQKHAVGTDSWLYTAIMADKLSSIILYGPAGTGKTTLAHVIAAQTKAEFIEINAVSASVKDIREAIAAARQRLSSYGQRTILFIDEIHRFSRSQQDALLHAVENGVVILIGATTENPYFEVNSALNSRSQIIELKALSNDELSLLLERALTSDKGLQQKFTLEAQAKEELLRLSGGDARSALNLLELAAQYEEEEVRSAGKELNYPLRIHKGSLEKIAPQRTLHYDKKGDQHYDLISAFIKSMRGSDPDAAVYYLAAMLHAGEDPKFIARRIFILASEDIGNADPQALCIASAAFKACEVIGMPECRLNLAQAAIYMALAPKSNASYQAYNRAAAEIRKGPERAIPSYLRDRHRPGSEGYGTYKYPHNYPSAYVEQRYLPEGLEKGDFYQASERGWEAYRTESSWRDRGGEALAAQVFRPSEDD